MHNARYQASEQAIADALLACLEHTAVADITVSDIAREAKISRNTFYAHYGNVMDAYRALVSRVDLLARDIHDQLACRDCNENDGKRTFCEIVRSKGGVGTIARDQAFLDYLLDSESSPGYQAHIRKFTAAGIPESLARSLWLFQMGGCYIAATHMACTKGEWDCCKALIDRFSSAGMESIGVRIEKPEP